MQPQVRIWHVFSIPQGNAIQLGELATGTGILALWAARPGAERRSGALVAGWLLTYFGSHALAHWMVGRLLGIRFVGYGLHGATAPQGYPPGMRWVMSRLPFLSARTDRESRLAARPGVRAAMYAAGPLGTVLAGIGVPLYARAANIPGAGRLLLFAATWIMGMMVGEAREPHSDLRRAWRELRRSAASGSAPPG